MADDLMGRLAAGLRGAGSVLSPQVFRGMEAERLQQNQLDSQKNQVTARHIMNGIQSGAIEPEQGQKMLQQIGYPMQGIGPSAETKQRQEEARVEAAIREIAPRFVKPDGTLDAQRMIGAIGSRDPVLAMKLSKKFGVENKIIPPGATMVDSSGNPVYTNPGAEKGPLSSVGKLMADRDKLPPGDPRRAMYDQAISKIGSGQSVNVSVDMGLGKAGQNKVDEGLLDTSDSLYRINQIERSFKPEFLNIPARAGFAWDSLKDKFEQLPADRKQALAEYSTFRQTTVDSLNRYIKSITGAAMSEPEAQRILAGMPKAGTGVFDGDSPTEFKSKMDNTIKNTKMALARLAYIKRNGIAMWRADNKTPVISLEAMPSIMNARGAEIAKQFRSQGIPDEQIDSRVRDMLSAEFGLVGR